MFPGQLYKCEICKSIKERDIYIYDSENFTVYAHPMPFNNGHVVVALNRHINIRDIKENILSEAHILISKIIKLIKKMYNPHGINVIVEEDHTAFHVVPRWVGDVSFTTLIHGFKVVPQLPFQVAENMRKHV